MTTWKMRHEGSPQHVEGLTAEEIVEGVLEGHWEPSDEVMGPKDTAWRSLEIHPHFATAMANYEPPTSPPHADEARLDMNPLIDVSLVLLIFFILTATYEELRKKFPVPGSAKDDIQTAQPIEKVNEMTIRAKIQFEDGKDVYLIEDQPVAEDQLQKTLEDRVKQSGKFKLGIEVDRRSSWKSFMKIQDAAAGAKIQEVIRIEKVAGPPQSQ